MLNPPVTSKTAAKYHRLAIAHVPAYRRAFEYEWGEEVKVDESAEIPETHIPVVRRIRREYLRQGEQGVVKTRWWSIRMIIKLMGEG